VIAPRPPTVPARAGVLVVAVLLGAGCTESVGPARLKPAASLSALSTSGITLDQWNGTLRQQNVTVLENAFNPTNPHRGDAIIATFFWVGSTNIIDSVTDRVANAAFSPVGNRYTLVEYVTAGGISMATYVATNVQNFPDASTSPDSILAVRATLSAPVPDGGVILSAWSGVSYVSAQMVEAHRSATGSDSATSTVTPGAITVGAGALVYGVAMSDGLVGVGRPPDFTRIRGLTDAAIKTDAVYAVPASGGSVEPSWAWFFTSERPGTWLATVLALTPAGIALDQANGALSQSGSMLIKGFDPMNPRHGDAIIATFFWQGSTNIIDSVTDHLADVAYTPVRNRYTLVEYVTAGGVSMATYVATNVQNFPDAGMGPGRILAVRANLSEPVVDGGVVLSAYRGVHTVPEQALGAHRSATGADSATTTAAPGAIAVGAGALVYGVTMSNAQVGNVPSFGFARIRGLSDALLTTDARYAVAPDSGSVEPSWAWHFTPQRSGAWLASVLALNPAVP
jgi:hypothetical protein